MSATVNIREVRTALDGRSEPLEKRVERLSRDVDRHVNREQYEARARKSFLEAAADEPIEKVAPTAPMPLRQQQIHDTGLEWTEKSLCKIFADFTQDDDDARLVSRVKTLVKAYRLQKANMAPVSVAEPDAKEAATESARVRASIMEVIGR